MPNHKDDWWFVDKEGRKIGWMWPEDFDNFLISLHGDRARAVLFADEFGISRTTVDRWRKGATPIPKYIALLCQLHADMINLGEEVKPVDAAWLPLGSGSSSPHERRRAPLAKATPRAGG
jgi:hypothetical protein